MAQPDRNGTIHTDGDTTTITFRRWLPHSVEAMWTAITDPDSCRHGSGKRPSRHAKAETWTSFPVHRRRLPLVSPKICGRRLGH